MEKDYSGKTMIKVPPCKAPDPCKDYDDYDPCESNEDITEKDLAVLLKEEQAKLQREKEKAEAELRKQQQQQAEGAKEVPDGREMVDGEEGRKPCQRVKKRLCRKLIKNPFFTNRLGFSSDLPPPPPVPPPQFFPPLEDSDSKLKVCPKRRKKCKKKSRDENRDGDEGPVEEEKVEEEEECLCLYEDECMEEETDVDTRKGKRRCKKPERFPCRKKVSEVSITLQPRQIPALQRDLPPTSPKEIPEVERQIMMACGKDCEIDCTKKKCKKKSEKVK